MKIHPDIEMLEIVAQALSPIRNRVTFVGGATTTLYIDDPAAPTSMATEDVDCIVEVASYLDYQRLEKQLRGLGFRQPVLGENQPICRWSLGGILVDVMPTDPKILGFSNRWYREGIDNRERASLPSGNSIYIFSIPYFIASKLEAFHSRGSGDPRGSHDLEDIVLVLDGNVGVLQTLRKAPKTVAKSLRGVFIGWLENPVYQEAIEGALTGAGEPASRVVRVLSILTEFVKSRSK